MSASRWLVFLAGIIIALCGPWWRPIWTDETAQFALGAFASLREAWDAFLPTTKGLNHGQTGAYYMWAHLILKLTGASAFALRLPSMICGGLLLWFLYLFAQTLKLSASWCAWLFLAFFSQRWINDYFGEARPYMPLAMACVGLLAYYLTALDQRSKNCSITWAAYLSVIIGAICHPYFGLYWFSLVMFSFLYQRAVFNVALNPKNFITHSNLALSIIGSLLFLGIGYATWLTHHIHFGPENDPFHFLPKDFSLPRYLYASHFLFLKKLKTPFLFFIMGGFAFQLYKTLARPQKLKTDVDLQILFSLGLIILGLGLSILVSWVSYKNNYWILERQWIGSVAMVTLGTGWLAASLNRKLLLIKSHQWQKLWLGSCWLLIIFDAVTMAHFKVNLIASWRHYSLNANYSDIDRSKPAVEKKLKWSRIAEANIAEGGPVWPIFKQMYGVFDNEPPK